MPVSNSALHIDVCISLDATAIGSAFFGAGTGSIFLDSVACNGDEANLTSCVADTETRDCSHAQDASVTCNTECKCSTALYICW